ncbi:MAG: HDOD domain-containing protein [Nitrospira sp.]|nr:HDOD domain-containing protein [Nitrospira sp.]
MTSPGTATDSPLITSIRPRLHRNLVPLLDESSCCLPILRSTCQSILHHMDPQSNAGNLAQVISQDHGLTCKVLQVANSIAYSPQQMITSVPHAVSWLGYDSIRSLVAAAHLVEQLQHWPTRQKEFHALIAKSLLSATFANELGISTGYPQLGELFTSALLYSIGDLAIAYQDPALFEALEAISRKFTNPDTRILQEKRLIGIPRLTLAQALGQMWMLPDDLISLFRNHEALPIGRWNGGFSTYRGIVVGSIQLIEAMTDPALPDPIEDARRTLLRGSGLSSVSFTDFMTRATDRGRQLINSMGLALQFSDGAQEAASATETDESIEIQSPSETTVREQPSTPHTHNLSAAPIHAMPVETLQAFQVSLQTAEDLNDLLHRFVQFLHRDAEFDRVGLALLNQNDSDLLVGRRAIGVAPLAPYLRSISGSLSREHHFFLSILKQVDPLLIDDVPARTTGRIKQDFLKVWKPTSAIFTPLRVGMKPIGLVYCDRGTSGQPVMPQDLQALQLFFAQMTINLNRLSDIL